MNVVDETVVARALDFDGIRIGYDARVLEPRPWTARQSHRAARLAEVVPPGPVLELCSGAGHIGLLAVRDSDRRLVMVDASPVACAWSRANAEAAGMAGRVEVREGLMGEVLAPDEVFPLIVADPPWVRSAEVATYPEDPLLAIDGGADGLDVVRATLDAISAHLAPQGAAVLQVGPTQVDAVEGLLLRHAPGLVVTDHEVVEGRGALVELRRD